MSWGNSWMKARCHWKDVLEKLEPSIKPIQQPDVDCLTGLKFIRNKQTRDQDKKGPSPVPVEVRVRGDDSKAIRANLDSTLTFDPTDSSTIPINFPCMQSRPLVYHSHDAFHQLEKSQGKLKLKHMCEYMLLIDKVKDTSDMFTMWNTATSHDFHDFSPVFLLNREKGWLDMLAKFEENEVKACQEGGDVQRNNLRASNSGFYPDICSKNQRLLSKQNYAEGNGDGGAEMYISYSVIEKKRRLQLRDVTKLLFSDGDRLSLQREAIAADDGNVTIDAGAGDPSMYRMYFSAKNRGIDGE
jgi:hypothetical protein